jgi:hypothetical protein
VRVFIGVSAYTYMSIYVYTMFLKNHKISIFIFHFTNLLDNFTNWGHNFATAVSWTKPRKEG